MTLRIKDLSVSYGAISALKDISFEVPEGKIVAVIGANGAGKTTLLRTISGLMSSVGIDCQRELITRRTLAKKSRGSIALLG